ncbi:phospholipase A2 isozymes PA3A/PA3B/PA5-like isoform X2 [Venturia canescens]|uniref:phospholipase A2 isozymes PA3A/PA3B/PA5-like isoform X2 n=1 Tax=Venturia canescens TaxID=32260 RepID=UPI001C9D0C5E|nr:phospholipase A2 isozymes PA3A/PA3B/PA5-like isoform X2 [Venturia canescens]
MNFKIDKKFGSVWSKSQYSNSCENSDYGYVHRRFSRQIAPGTKWCGNGDRAIDDKDLGYFRETDKCCREHDKCSMDIKGKETKYGLTNPDMFTRSHCDCDKKFYECLTDVSTRMSRTIGEIYFNFLGKKCFREKTCPPGMTCEKAYEWVDGNVWLPTVDELRKMYKMISILIPELEFDPFEDDIIGVIGDASNKTISQPSPARS